jgi:plasmid stability protein
MTVITVRDVPDEVRDELAARAARGGMSMQEYLRAHLIDLTGRPSASDALAQVRARARTYPRLTWADLVDGIDEDRR